MAHPRDLTTIAPAQMAVLDRLMPSIWPEVWADFARVFFVGLINAQSEVNASVEALARVAIEQVRTLGHQLGGTQPYIPCGAVAARREIAEAICRDFRGNNYGELAAKHGLTESRVRNILRENR